MNLFSRQLDDTSKWRQAWKSEKFIRLRTEYELLAQQRNISIPNALATLFAVVPDRRSILIGALMGIASFSAAMVGVLLLYLPDPGSRMTQLLSLPLSKSILQRLGGTLREHLRAEAPRAGVN
jgi:hypothetical protein